MNAQPVSTASPVAILGMHRSGTSCLAGSLEEAGLHLGEVNTQAPYNARGNRENRAIMDLHDDVLQASGGTWDRPPASANWSDAQRSRRDAIILSYPAHIPWGFKEPRSLLVLEGWIEALPLLRLVGTFRHPAAVAASLAHRNQFVPETSYAIWLAYNRRLIAFQRRFDFPLISFDWPHARYLQALQALAQRLDLAPPQGGFRFFASELRKNEPPDDASLPAEVREIYETLQGLAA